MDNPDALAGFFSIFLGQMCEGKFFFFRFEDNMKWKDKIMPLIWEHVEFD